MPKIEFHKPETRLQFCKDAAEFNETRSHRWALTRQLSPAMHVLKDPPEIAAFIMLNPSTADETQNDPTIRRCIGFAEDWGCRGLFIFNMFAVRATDPREMDKHPDPVGPINDKAIYAGLRLTNGPVVVAWGADKMVSAERERAIYDVIRTAGDVPQCLGTTKDGHPRHPLYLRKDTPLEPWEPRS